MLNDLQKASLLDSIISQAEALKGELILTTPAVPTVTLAPLLVPTVVQSMVQDANGVWKSVEGWESTLTCLQFAHPEITYGSKVDVKFKRAGSYPLSGNLKWFRMWNSSAFKYPDLYVGTPDGKWIMFYTELLAVNPNTRFTLTNYPPAKDGSTHTEEFIMKMPSAQGKADGSFQILVDGVSVFQTTAWQVDDSVNPGVPNYICIQDDPSNWTPPAGSWVSYSDISIIVS